MVHERYPRTATIERDNILGIDELTIRVNTSQCWTIDLTPSEIRSVRTACDAYLSDQAPAERHPEWDACRRKS